MRTGTRTAGRQTRMARAFSLMEVMIVLVIILLIAGLVGYNLLGTKGEADKKVVRQQLNILKGAVKMFQIEYNRFPTDEEGIEVLWSKEKLSSDADASKWRKFTDEAVPTDLWGSAWNYKQVGEKAPEGMFDLFSSGPDKEAGTEDDISVWPKTGDAATDSGPPPAPSSGGSRPPPSRP